MISPASTLLPIFIRLVITRIVPAIAYIATEANERRSTPASTGPPPVPEWAPLHEGTVWFQASCTDVTYDDLLVQHLRGADSITIVDPHVKTLRQIRNLQELLEGLACANDKGHEISVTLVTSDPLADPALRHAQSELLVDLIGIVAREGVRLNVTFDNTIHDRWIETDEWKIILGKGLDIWRHSAGRLDPGYRRQELREVSKTFSVTYCSKVERPSCSMQFASVTGGTRVAQERPSAIGSRAPGQDRRANSPSTAPNYHPPTGSRRLS